MFKEPTSSSASKLLFLVFPFPEKVLLSTAFHPSFLSPFQTKFHCAHWFQELFGDPLHFQDLTPLLTLNWKRLQPPLETSPHQNSEVIHSLSSFKAEVMIIPCILIPSNGKRKIHLAYQYYCTPIFTAKLTSRIFFAKKKAIKNLVTWKGSPMSCQD